MDPTELTRLAMSMRTVHGMQTTSDLPNILEDVMHRAHRRGRIATSSRLAAAPWYVFANPAIGPCLKVVFLNGQTEPTVVQSEHCETGYPLALDPDGRDYEIAAIDKQLAGMVSMRLRRREE